MLTWIKYQDFKVVPVWEQCERIWTSLICSFYVVTKMSRQGCGLLFFGLLSAFLLVVILSWRKINKDKYEFQGTSWRALCSNLHPVQHQETAFHFYISVSVNPPTLQSYKIIHIYVTQNSTASSYMSITVTPCLHWVAVNLLPGQNDFHLLWEFMPFITTAEQKYPLLITGVTSVESCSGLGWKGPCPDILKGYLPLLQLYLLSHHPPLSKLILW